MHGQGGPGGWWQQQLAGVAGLLAISTMMFDGREVDAIVELAVTAVPSLGAGEVVAVYVVADGLLEPVPRGPALDPELDRHVRDLGEAGGEIVMADGMWRWAYPLTGLGGDIGRLVVKAAHGPSPDEVFLLRALGQQLAGALANASLRRRERAHIDDLHDLNTELSAVVARLERRTAVHDELNRVSASGAGDAGIADALHRLTALPVVIEDKFGNLRMWSGPGRLDPYPKPGAAERTELLRQAATTPHPVRVRDRVVSVVRPRHEVLGVLALIDPAGTVGRHEMFALEYATTVLSLELAHQRNLAEVELRVHRELVDDLIAGVDDDSVYARADAVGYDLRGPHHVVVLRWSGPTTDEAIGQMVSALGLRALCARRSEATVLIVSGRPDGDAMHRVLAEVLDSPDGAIGIGGPCDGLADVPRSYREASRALDIRRHSRAPNGVTAYHELGVYRLLDTGQNRVEIVAFVREWLGPLLDYDRHKRADLVRTLFHYLECGGSYDETAAALTIHRSTLRYRLGRIRKITELDLNDVDSRLNLHVATRAWQVMREME
ncbi:CdaR family transcriptional regulator [Kutzneria buriramensis]|uniref:Sugar diacid utilization regulator n=1 Tax=Kutzneria buriramensis TaxID=1045776 RepID=A0A3E0HR51_9PSEU|nr:helix-turn-helix domain-containing protein [Kutzneria buriramensis]REH48465.1 sugar diacid utilization regulator [Kutzneria buriramensis]